MREMSGAPGPRLETLQTCDAPACHLATSACWAAGIRTRLMSSIPRALCCVRQPLARQGAPAAYPEATKGA